MEIQNFTDIAIRIGEFPQCLDITNVDGCHSGYGLKAFFFAHKLEGEEHFMQIRKRKDMKGLVLYIFWKERQLESLPEYVGDVVFDSRDIEL